MGQAGTSVGFQLGPWTVEPRARTLTRGGLSRRVSPKAMAVLHALADAEGAVLSREELIDLVWPDVVVCDEVLTHAVGELRRALEGGADQAPFIETVYKAGYRLLQPARPAGPAAATASAQALTEAFAAFLEAQALAESGGGANILEAIRLYREAVAADPAFASAHAGLAVTLVKCRNYYGGGAGMLSEAGVAAETAIGLDRSACEGHTARGAVLSALGDDGRALASFQSAIQLRPDAAETYRLLGRVFFAAGAFAAAAAACDRSSALRADELRALLLSAKAQRAIGDRDGAVERMRRARIRSEQRLTEEPANVRALCNLICFLTDEGRVDEAMALLPRVRGQPDTITYYLVGGLARIGEIDLALDQLEAVVGQGWSDAAYLARDPDLEVLRREPRFRRIAARLEASA